MRTERTEREMAMEIQQLKGELLKLLPAADRETTKKAGSTEPETFEDKARAYAGLLCAKGLTKANAGMPEDDGVRGVTIMAALLRFQEAVNVYWTWAMAHGVPEALSAEWRKKHRAAGQTISKEDVESEVLFRLRHFIVLFNPKNEERLFSYAYRGILQHLTEWSAQQGPVQLPRDVARGAKLTHVRESLTEDRSAGVGAIKGADGTWRAPSEVPGGGGACDPWDLVDRYLDGEIAEEDL